MLLIRVVEAVMKELRLTLHSDRGHLRTILSPQSRAFAFLYASLPWLTLNMALAQTTAPSECRQITDLAARLRCLEAPAPVPKMPQSGVLSGWKMIRSPDPRGGPEAVGMIRIADFSRSDPDFAGMMLRCAGTELEVLAVVVRPRPPRAKPRVSVQVGHNHTVFEASVVPPGASLLLPQPAPALARVAWQSGAEARVSIEHDGEKVGGVVPLAGLGAALPHLLSNCTR
jgi:hypothetical protein